MRDMTLVQCIIADHKQVIFECIKAGWERWKVQQKTDPTNTRLLSSRSISTTLHDYMCHEFSVRFGEHAEVKPTKRHGKFTLSFGGQLAARVKKLDRKGKPSGNKTRSELQFTHQLVLPEFPEDVMVTIGYTLDALRTELLDVRILVQEAGEVIFWFSLMNEDMAQQTIFSAPEFQPEPEPPVQMPRRVTAKKGIKRQSDVES